MPNRSASISSVAFSLLSLALLLTFAPSLVGCGGAGDAPRDEASADLVVWGGTILTMADEGDGVAPEVEAVAVRGGRVVAAGSRAEVEGLVGESTEVVDLAGRTAMPGFVEAHAHFLGLGQAKLQLDLRGASSWQEIVEQVRAAAAETPEGEWILGRGWHQEKWSESPGRTVAGFPVHDLLSAAVPDHPVSLGHASGHALLANAKAMELAGVGADTADPSGGAILRDADGKATGVFNESAEALIAAAMTEPSAESVRRQIETATAECLQKGVTSFHDAGTGFAGIDALRAAAADGALGVRLWVMAAASTDELAAQLPSYTQPTGNPAVDDLVTVGGIKRYMDGALGSRGAWLLEPYADDPQTVGHPQTDREALRAVAEVAVETGVQLCVHAIGDRANREVLDVFEETFAAHPDAADLRWRIEHAQHLHPDDVGRFAALGVVASMQPVHCTSDGPWVPQRLGDARSASGAYLWSDLIDSGAVVVSGTDAPVEDVDPIANFRAAATRELGDGTRFYPEQAMTRDEALRSMTRAAAWSVFQDDEVGSLVPGRFGDLIVLSADPRTVSDDEFTELAVEMTVVGGEVVYRADG